MGKSAKDILTASRAWLRETKILLSGAGVLRTGGVHNAVDLERRSLTGVVAESEHTEG